MDPQKSHPSGPEAQRIEELLGRYVEELLVHGRAPNPEELCRDSPELLGSLREHIREYERLNRILGPPEGLGGRALLHYRIVEPLGAGGMGQVYLAEDTKLGRRVAVKVLPPEMAADQERLERFRREARLVAALNHPNIVTLYSVEETEDLVFLTMELVEGKTLDALIPGGGMEPGRLLEIAEQLVDALVAAHERGIIHRDLKPPNLMVGANGRLKVLDFGLAKLQAPAGGEEADSDRNLTVEGRILGTVPYMSPEQILGGPLDPRTDLYSLGVILYETATGRRPFRGKNAAEVISAILRDPPTPVSELRDDLPGHLERIVRRCLEKDPERRFHSASEVRNELDEARRAIEADGALAGRESRRVFISSTSDELAPYRAAAREVVAELGFEPVTVEHPETAGGVGECARRVDAADALLAIVGWRQGKVPGPELGGDAQRSYTQWEVLSAFRRAKPVLVLMADDRWPEELWDDDSEARVLIRDFRGELDRLAVLIEYEVIADGSEPTLPGFRAQLAQALERYRQGMTAKSGPPAPSGDGKRRLRTRPAPELPERPYPVLLPYTHPDLLAGRERELAELRQLLQLPVPILGLYGLSGAGKSSLLAGGLVPALRAEGRPVAFDRHPDEPGLAGRLLGDLLIADGDDGALDIDDDAPGRQAFVDRLVAVRRLADPTPVLVLDQFEDLLRRSDRRRSRAVVGALLAASIQRQPGLDGPLCRWLLAYRQEFHGELFRWLADVLREARSEGLAAVETLPHDLSGPERFHGWPLPPLGTPPPGATDRLSEAARAFEEAIEKPLSLGTDDGAPRYPWRFSGDGAARLARAFGAARLARPATPLAPELQVVLAHLLEEAGELSGDPPRGTTVAVEVPEEPGELIDRALEEHLRRALDAAFPAARTAETPFAGPNSDNGPKPGPSQHLRPTAAREKTRLGRSRALLALRELADVRGRREEGLDAEALAQAIGAEGREVLEKLATPLTRLVVLEEHPDGWCYVLSHDRMAEVLVRVVDDEGRYGKLGVDAELLALRRFVVLNTELYRSGETAQATRVPRAHFRPLEAHADALLWGEDRRRWWAACRKRRRADRRRAVTWRTIAAAVLLLVTIGAWTWADRRAQLRASYEQIAEGEPEAVLAALDRLASAPGPDLEELLSRLRQRESPTDLLERGMDGVNEEDRSTAVLRAVEIALPLVVETPDDPVLIANLVWALDYAPGRDPPHALRARALRDRVLAPLRRRRPPPPAPGPGDPDWADVPGGTFQMGSAPGEIPGRENDALKYFQREIPKHQVSISPFRMLIHEVTNREYRRLIPDHEGADDLGARVNWYQAYTYAVWLGGRLPTEAEWEYAARAGCPYEYCTREGEETTLGKVAWIRWNSRSNENGLPVKQLENGLPVMQLEPNPWGLFDMYGNSSEWAADWFGEYPAVSQQDPWGPPAGVRRIERGGACWYTDPATTARAAARGTRPPGEETTRHGLRVVLPAASGGA